MYLENHFFLPFIFFEIFQRVYLNCVYTVCRRNRSCYIFERFEKRCTDVLILIVVIRREISVRNSC